MDDRNDPVAELGRLLASKGVPPFVVASNISDPSYTSVRLWKENGCVRVETTCVDDETQQEHLYTYRYDAASVLQRIEMTVAGRSCTVWDRQSDIAKLGAAISARTATPAE